MVGVAGTVREVLVLLGARLLIPDIEIDLVLRVEPIELRSPATGPVFLDKDKAELKDWRRGVAPTDAEKGDPIKGLPGLTGEWIRRPAS